MDWFLHDTGLRHKSIKRIDEILFPVKTLDKTRKNLLGIIYLVLTQNFPKN